ncbi:MAG: amidohydrolase family protein [Gammaproteobacteria bacterium]|nr:amidohydrolase family protein [Gammaproteobacteria bacterium]MDE0412979.1 amidohydrolase family protein [Gammaproteobacteria bacterium]
MWIRKSEKDRKEGRRTPIPTQVVSNEEYIPMPQSEDQRRVERRIHELADRLAGRRKMSRRQYLGSAAGMAAAFLAMNEVFGRYFLVDWAEAAEAGAERESWPDFIFDAQLHHVKEGIVGPLGFRRLAGMFNLNPDLVGVKPGREDLQLENFTKEVFLDSETTMGIISGAPLGDDRYNILPVDMMVETRRTINELAGSQRMLSHGLAAPNMPGGLEEIERQAVELKVDGWKCYTGVPVNPWRMDDEKVAYPFYELALKLGITNISVHKGLPIVGTDPEYCRPWDIRKAALDWPDLNFIVYHSGFRNLVNELAAGNTGIDENGYLVWTSDIVKDRLETPAMTNVYMELGSVFGHTAITHPEICSHLMGQILKAFGSDRVIWGTDSIWWGSPQWQIEAFRRFEMPEALQERHGYPALTREDKELILGLNSARLYGIDVPAALETIPGDRLSGMRAAYLESGPQPSNTQYGWVHEGPLAEDPEVPWSTPI